MCRKLLSNPIPLLFMANVVNLQLFQTFSIPSTSPNMIYLCKVPIQIYIQRERERNSSTRYPSLLLHYQVVIQLWPCDNIIQPHIRMAGEQSSWLGECVKGRQEEQPAFYVLVRIKLPFMQTARVTCVSQITCVDQFWTCNIFFLTEKKNKKKTKKETIREKKEQKLKSNSKSIGRKTIKYNAYSLSLFSA